MSISRREFFEASVAASAMTGMTRPAGAAAPQPSTQDQWFSGVPAGRSVVRASHGMVATSQLLDKYGTMKLADLMAPAIGYAENGFPIMEKTAADWEPEVPRLELTAAAASTYLVNGGAPRPGAMFAQKNLARTFRTLARGGRDAFYRGEIARAIVDYRRANGGV